MTPASVVETSSGCCAASMTFRDKSTTLANLTNTFDLGRWCTRGACRRQPTAWWFAVRPLEVARARRICDTCPVRTECLAHALARPSLLGIWGATTPNERSAIRARDEIPHAVPGPIASRR